MTLWALALAAVKAATPADGHTVAPIPGATPTSELKCEAPLENAWLAPGPGGTWGVRAPARPGKVSCTLNKQGAKKTETVTLEFVDQAPPFALAPDHLPLLGTDTEAALDASGPVARADGSFGNVKVDRAHVTAGLPTIRMPQHLVVLALSPAGDPAYTVVPLLGKAKVSVTTKKNAKLEVVVAGRRTTGFKSDKKGKVDVAVPAPPGFAGGLLEVDPSKKKKGAETELQLPQAKPLFALAALGPADAVPSGSRFVIYVAGANPQGLPPNDSELVAVGTFTTIDKTEVLQPGLWKLTGKAPAAGAATVVLTLGGASRTVAIAVAPPVATEPPKPEVKVEPKLTTEPKPDPKGTLTQKPPELPVDHAVVTQTPAAATDEKALHLGLLVEAGYLTNFGSVGGLAPGVGVQLGYRLGSLDVGGAVDALFTTGTRQGQVTVSGGSIDTTTSTQVIQSMVGPWARWRFTDIIGVSASAGLGISRVAQSITANGSVNSSGTSTSLAFGGLAGLDLDFNVVRVFGGARYLQSSASGSLTGPAGGLTGLVGVGVDLGF
jgi:hypothetical protein